MCFVIVNELFTATIPEKMFNRVAAKIGLRTRVINGTFFRVK